MATLLKLAFRPLEICSPSRCDLQGFIVCVLGSSVPGFDLGVTNGYFVNVSVTEDGEDRG